MPDEKTAFERWSSALKDFVSTLRDSVIFILFIMLLFAPGTVKERLLAAGFTKGNIGGLEWEGQIKQSAEQTKAVGEVVSKADENYKVLIDRLSELEKSVSDPSVKRSLTNLSADAKVSQGELVVADRAVKRSLYAQQAIVESVAPSTVSDRGWLFLGKVSESKAEWAPGSPLTIASASPSLKPGMKLTIRDDAYWRAESASGSHANAAIVSVARVGTVVNVEDVDYSHAKGGGWFVWVKAHQAS